MIKLFYKTHLLRTLRYGGQHMGKLVKLPAEANKVLKASKAYHYQIGPDTEPILIYKSIGDEKHVYHIRDDSDSYNIRYAAEAIHAMLHERKKKQVIIKHEDITEPLEFYPADHVWDIFRKLLLIEQHYFRSKGTKR